jgi:hypothetical protein
LRNPRTLNTVNTQININQYQPTTVITVIINHHVDHLLYLVPSTLSEHADWSIPLAQLSHPGEAKKLRDALVHCPVRDS